jgi:hypothetical protein
MLRNRKNKNEIHEMDVRNLVVRPLPLPLPLPLLNAEF